jgi:NADPH-dependent 7-cyano-7-deazaguanine reductase QueF
LTVFFLYIKVIKTISLPYKITGTRIIIPFKAICSVTDKEFGGDVIIEYHPSKKALEYVHTEEIIKNLSCGKITAEDLVNSVYQEVMKSIKPNYLKIMVDVKYSKAHKPVQVWLES